MRGAYLGQVNAEQVAEELERQLAMFIRVMGIAPDYIDGHQHVHLLPGIRQAVTDAARRIGAYVRSTHEPIDASMALRPSFVESAFLSWTARPLERLILGRNLISNRGFRGVRGFRERAAYHALFRRMIAGARTGSIIMCHPGSADGVLAARDLVTTAREEELRYFASVKFLQDISMEGLTLARLHDALA
jgi:chitin disaccharide deacetylase